MVDVSLNSSMIEAAVCGLAAVFFTINGIKTYGNATDYPLLWKATSVFQSASCLMSLIFDAFVLGYGSGCELGNSLWPFRWVVFCLTMVTYTGFLTSSLVLALLQNRFQPPIVLSFLIDDKPQEHSMFQSLTIFFCLTAALQNFAYTYAGPIKAKFFS